MRRKAERNAEIYELYETTDLTLEQVGDRFDLSGPRVSQIVNAERERRGPNAIIAPPKGYRRDPDRPPPGGSSPCPTCGSPRWFRGAKVRV